MHTNALIHQKSPYLRQHAHNPVDWLPWGQAAFEKSRREDKPIFLSVGYSTCHWCHVMAHESFEDPATAEVLNRDFVPVKVDREERPDVDRIYMLFVQASSGSGGWPMSVWLTPELKPFFGGTYFPPDSRYGRPGFRDVLQHLARAWKQERDRVESSSASVAEQLRAITASSAQSAATPDNELFASAYWQFRRSFDARWGGFGGAPKFPRPVVLNYLLRYFAIENNSEALEMVVQTLHGMTRGGMHDHLGGGFHRYSVDEGWFVPHFEKMLYDQAQLAISYLEAHQATGEQCLANTARGIFRYVARDLKESEGGFYSAEDADSPDPDNPSHSGEGAFYLWKKSEIESILSENAARFCQAYGVEPQGNVGNDPQGEFTGRNILYEASPAGAQLEPDLREASEKLFSARSKRPRPHLDNKILTAWNGLMISAFAKGFSVFEDRQYLDLADRAASFLLTRMYNPDSGQLLRRYSGGEAAIPGFLDDYAFLAQALLDLFEVTSNARYLKTAVDFATRGFQRFEDRDSGGFFSTEPDAPDLFLRVKDDYDGAEPSGNSVATDVLLRLSHLTGNSEFQRMAEKSLEAFVPKIQSQPTIAPQMLAAVGRWLAVPEQVVIRCSRIDSDIQRIVAESRKKFAPYRVVLAITDEAAAQLQGTAAFLSGLERKGRATIYECRNFVCELPKVI